MRLLLVLAGCAAAPAPDAPTYAEVSPVLERHCTRCHTSEGRRDGGVELDRYASARSTRVRAACTAVEADVAERYGLHSENADPGAAPCEGWRPASMPPGAIEHLTPAEQELLARWVVAEGPP
ncbi:MAG: hypothetical protein H6737_28545 [Alphaproteobacteria bacterium]|nr:hypothetical protein [Alphaproteobacteria bacterium]